MKSAPPQAGSNPTRTDLKEVSAPKPDQDQGADSLPLGRSSAWHGANISLSLSPTAGLFEALSKPEIVMDEVIGNSGGVKVRARVTGRQEGTLFGVPASGQQVIVLHQAFHRFKEGIIYETHRLEDWSGISRRSGG